MKYLSISSLAWFRYCWKVRKSEPFIGIFRNLPGVIPGRWGFYIGGLEVGSRMPGDPVGVWMKERGLWPW